MTGPNLTVPLQALDGACQQLQMRVGADAKAAELLYCMRGLLTQWTVQQADAPALAAQALTDLEHLRPALEALTGPLPTHASLPTLLRAAHDRLAALPVPEAAPLCQRLVQIETAHTAAIEQAFQQRLQPPQVADPAAATAGFDTHALARYLAQVLDAPGLEVTAIEVISGGFSKQTAKVGLRGAATAQVPTTLILRLDQPAETAFTATKVVDEFPVLQAAWRHGVKVPRPYAVEASGQVLGRPFIVLDVVPGRTVGTLFHFPPPDAALGADIARQLAALHRVPLAELGPSLAGASVATADRIREEIAVSRRHWDALGRPSVIVEAGFHALERQLHWADGARCLVHGDLGLHNLMVDGGQVSAVLDWEFGKAGNPADDLGYFQDTASHLMGWDAFLAEYQRSGGQVPPPEQIGFYRLLALVRVAVLVSQADAAFNAGVLPQIQYAPPGSYFLRGVLVKLGQCLQRMA